MRVAGTRGLEEGLGLLPRPEVPAVPVLWPEMLGPHVRGRQQGKAEA